MDNIYAVLGWGSPIGTGIFLLCLGGMIHLLSRSGKESSRRPNT